MASENTITIVGNVTEDPELRYTATGAAVANFTVAVNKRFRGQDGNWEDRLDGFFRCNCWRDMAENVTESITKGTRVMVVGRLQQRNWETNDGQKRYEIEIQVDEIGPSLRWATANVQKSNRSSGGSGNFGGGQQAPAGGAPAQAPAAADQVAPAAAPTQPAQGGAQQPGNEDWGSSAPAGAPADMDQGGF